MAERGSALFGLNKPIYTVFLILPILLPMVLVRSMNLEHLFANTLS